MILLMQDVCPPPEDVQTPLIRLIGNARRQIRQAFWARFGPLGLTPQQGWMLRILSAHGPLSLHGLAQWLFMDDPTACRIVKSLQDKNLVESSPDPGHGRRNIIKVSAEGARLAPALDQIADGLGRDLEEGLSSDERLALRSGLLKVIANLGHAASPKP